VSQKRNKNGKRDSIQTPQAKDYSTTPRGRRDSGQTSNGGRLHDLPSLELDTEGIEISKNDDFLGMKNLKEYMFNYANLLDDLDEEKVSKRLDNLSKFSVWKMKKWVAQNQRYLFWEKNFLLNFSKERK